MAAVPSLLTPTPDPVPADPPTLRRHWRDNLRITGILLAVWFVVTFVISFFARDLSFGFFGWPFSFWVAAQGALLIYAVLVAIYAHTMDRLDRRDGLTDTAA